RGGGRPATRARPPPRGTGRPAAHRCRPDRGAWSTLVAVRAGRVVDDVVVERVVRYRLVHEAAVGVGALRDPVEEVGVGDACLVVAGGQAGERPGGDGVGEGPRAGAVLGLHRAGTVRPPACRRP